MAALSVALFDSDGKKKSQSTILIEIGRHAERFHDHDGDPYAVLPVNDHREVWPLRSKPVREWLASWHYRLTDKGAGTQAMQDALDTLSAQACFDGACHAIHRRVAAEDGRIVIDMGCKAWRCVEVTAGGWRLLDTAPAMLTRTPKTLPLPDPVRSGDGIRRFQSLFGLSETNLRLIVGWILAALGGRRPFPVLVFQGEEGTGKSTLARACKALVDPATNALRSPPKDEKDLATAAINAWVLSLDNLSGLAPAMSDTLCRISTGGSISGRKLYTDGDEFSVEVTRPVIVNGIDTIVTRSDLAGRALLIHLEPITERKTERDLWHEFEALRPALLADLLDALVAALAHVDHTRVPDLPRLADFAQWITAAEAALPWPAGAFVATYRAEIDQQSEAIVQGKAVGAELLKLIRGRKTWTGTATDLLHELNLQADPATTRSKFWPINPESIGNEVRRLAPQLRRLGIRVDFDRIGKDRERHIILETLAEKPSELSEPSAMPPAIPPEADSSDGMDGKIPRVSKIDRLKNRWSKTYSEDELRAVAATVTDDDLPDLLNHPRTMLAAVKAATEARP